MQMFEETCLYMSLVSPALVKLGFVERWTLPLSYAIMSGCLRKQQYAASQDHLDQCSTTGDSVAFRKIISCLCLSWLYALHVCW